MPPTLAPTAMTFAVAFALAVAATPVARILAHRTGYTDQPSERKVHKQPTPLLGGAAIYAAAIAALVLFWGRSETLSQLAGILAGASLVALVGLWDDRRPLAPPIKLAGQVLGVLVAILAGVQVQISSLTWFNIVVTLIWMLAVTNALNFMDNMDGVLTGVAAVASAWILVLALGSDQQLVAPLAAALFGASLGFLVYNFNPASIFMGDAGSLFLGFVLAALGIKLRFPGVPTSVSWLIPLLVLAVPLFDLILVIVSRLRRGVNPFTTGGKDHFAHRLVRLGLSHRQAAVAVYALAILSGVMAWLASRADPGSARLAGLAVGLAALWGVWRLEIIAPAWLLDREI